MDKYFKRAGKVFLTRAANVLILLVGTLVAAGLTA